MATNKQESQKKFEVKLIENGLDSLKKGYDFLKAFEDIKDTEKSESARFSVLKDAIQSIQHGTEILFKYVLGKQNEVLLFTSVDQKLRDAFVKRRAGEINELMTVPGLHTVTFKESIDRLTDICGLEINEKFKKDLLKIESWRNSITHAFVDINEREASSILTRLMNSLDIFFGKNIGPDYLKGHGRQELKRAYEMFVATKGRHENERKEKVILRLIEVVNDHNIKVTAPGVFMIKDGQKAYDLMRYIQRDDLKFGCDLKNLYNSGEATFYNYSENGVMTIRTHDNKSYYSFKFAGLIGYIPKIESNISPLFYCFSDVLAPTASALSDEYEDCKWQIGITPSNSLQSFWDKNSVNQTLNGESDNFHTHYRFLSKGSLVFLNIAQLGYAKSDDLLHVKEFNEIDTLFNGFQKTLDAT